MPKSTVKKTSARNRSSGTHKQSGKQRGTTIVPRKKVAAQPITKLDLLSDLLNQPDGASIKEMCKATGWQSHSVRGALSGALKRKGLVIQSEVSDGIRRYRAGSPR